MAFECLRFLNEMKRGEEPRWLTLGGKSGVGKSHCAYRMASWFDRSGKFYECPVSGANLVRNGGFYPWSRLVTELREGNWGLRKQIIGQWFVVLDDIATENDRTGFVKEQIYAILEGRMGKWTVITVNLDLAGVADQIETRIASRLVRGRNKFVFTTAVDFALRGGAKK